MSWQWDSLCLIAAAEALVLVLATLPCPSSPLRKLVILVSSCMLQPLIAVVAFCFYLLLDIYWHHEHVPKCQQKLPPVCRLEDQFRHDTRLLKSQRNLVLVLVTLLLYWLLYSVTGMLVQLEGLSEQAKTTTKRPASGVERAREDDDYSD